jgi:hypothetical protein
VVASSPLSPVRFVRGLSRKIGLFRVVRGMEQGSFSALKTAWRREKDPNRRYRSQCSCYLEDSPTKSLVPFFRPEEYLAILPLFVRNSGLAQTESWPPMPAIVSAQALSASQFLRRKMLRGLCERGLASAHCSGTLPRGDFRCADAEI